MTSMAFLACRHEKESRLRRLLSAGPVEAASNAETSITQITQEYIVRAQVSTNKKTCALRTLLHA